MTVKKRWIRMAAGALASVLMLTGFSAAGEPQVRAEAAEMKVTVKRSDEYQYETYGFGSGFTREFTVKFGDVKGVGYCIQPSKNAPESGEYTVTKLSDGKSLAKVCYYGTSASGDDGFFEEAPEYRNLSREAQFIITHIAAAYANGSSDAFSQANAKAQELAKKLYKFCQSQPDIPDVEMSFTEPALKGYRSGDGQRTQSTTFRADEQQTITIRLPNGVSLHNETTGSTSSAGETVTIPGGTKFYLSAPLTQSRNVGDIWSARMRGSITKDYSVYKISTGSTQDLAVMFGDGLDAESYVNLQADWLDTADIALTKKDSVTGNGIAGAVYGIYRDSACTDLITRMPATDSQGKTQSLIVREQPSVYIREIQAPKGYVLDTQAYPAALAARAASSVALDVRERETLGEISVRKVDAQTETFEGQGDGVLTGAVYGLYAKEDIVHPDGHTGTLYQADALVDRKTFGEDGQITFSNLHLGSYYIKEITPPTGYCLDEKQYDVPLTYTDGSAAVVRTEQTVKEDVMRQAFQILKVTTDGGGGELPHVKGAEFTVKLKSETDRVGWEEAKVYDTLVTDESGYAKSIELPYGAYTVRETKTPDGMNAVPDFSVEVREDSREPQTWRILNDRPAQAYVRIVKKDAETGQTVLLADTAFRIRNTDTDEYVRQKVGSRKVDTFVTDENGTVTTPLMLKAGNYELTEVKAPGGYILETESVPFTVTGARAVQEGTDEDGDPLIEVVSRDAPVSGNLHIYKHGKQPVKEKKGGHKETVYRDGPLAGVVFEIAAAEDIYTPDNQKNEDGSRKLAVYANTILKKGAVAATVTTDEEGNASLEGLPLGSYLIREIRTADGFVLPTEETPFTLAYKDQDTAAVDCRIDLENFREGETVKAPKTGDVDLAGWQALIAVAALFGLCWFIIARKRNSPRKR